MLRILVCLGGVGLIVGVAQILWLKNIWRDERGRKLVHIGVATYVASWPWIISWHYIRLLSLLMLIVVTLNHSRQLLKISGQVKRKSYGEIFLAVSILITSMLTQTKLYFALAILNLSIADGFAAIVGSRYGQKHQYSILWDNKTYLGSATFFVCSTLVMLFGLVIGAEPHISHAHYMLLILTLPLILTIIEGSLGYGLDNLGVPMAVLFALYLAK